MPKVITKPTPESPFVVVLSAGYGMRGKHAHVAVVETDGMTEPSMISTRGRGVRNVVWWSGTVYYGKTERSESGRAIALAIEIAGHHNRLRFVNIRPVTVAEIDAAINETFRRNLIEAYTGGLAAYLKDSGAEEINADETGVLVRRQTSGEPVMAVLVKCPSTGRNYVLRVPPSIRTAREAVAWTFNIAADKYQPIAQS